MRKEDCFVLGTITRQHGYKGDVVAKIETDRPEHYNQMGSVLLESQGGLVPFFLEKAQVLKQGQLLLHFEGVHSAREADAFMGKDVYLPLSMLPPLTGKSFYFHEVVGFDVQTSGESIGQVAEVIDRPGQPIFKVVREEEEILIPAVDEFIDKIDRSEGILYLELPEGLVDLYR